MKICIVKPPSGGELVLRYMPFFDEEGSEYIRLTEIMDIEFPRLSDDETIQRQLKQIDAKEKELRMTFQRELNSIAAERQNLLALPNHA